MANTGVRAPTLDELGPLEMASRTGGWLASIWNMLDSPDFTEADRQNMRDWEKLRDDIPILTADKLRAPIFITLGKLSAKGEVSALHDLKQIKAKFPETEWAKWDEAIAEIEEVAKKGYTAADSALMEKFGATVTESFESNREAISENALRKGLGGRGALTREAALGSAQGMGGDLNQAGLGMLVNAQQRGDQARGQAANLRGAQTAFRGNFNQNEAAATNKFNTLIAQGLDAVNARNTNREWESDKLNLLREEGARDRTEAARYAEAARESKQRDQNMIQQWNMQRMATAGLSDARKGLQQTQAHQQAGAEDFRRGLGEGLPIAAEIGRGLFGGGGQEEDGAGAGTSQFTGQGGYGDYVDEADQPGAYTGPDTYDTDTGEPDGGGGGGGGSGSYGGYIESDEFGRSGAAPPPPRRRRRRGNR